jgi:hypothetical protein
MRIRKKRMRPRRLLRGAKLEGAAIRELSDLPYGTTRLLLGRRSRNG